MKWRTKYKRILANAFSIPMSNCASIGAANRKSITGTLSLSDKGLTEEPSGTFKELKQ